MTGEQALVLAVVDQHLRLRRLARAAVLAPEPEREAACSLLLRDLALHTAAEGVLLEGDRPTPRAVREARELTEAAERLEDLGTSGPGYGVRLGLLTAGVVRHVEAVEHDLLPRVAAARDDEELVRAAELLTAAADPGWAPDVGDPPSFRHLVRAAREQVCATARHPGGMARHREG